ncbi:MAG: sporulation protein YtfJ [Clostridia bacterium]|nr:sporulation protein YtfJ [Clostridia bacterium]
MNNNNETPMKQMIESALSKIKEVVDVNTVIGEAIHVSDDVTIIPFSRVSVGFASGGSEFGGKTPREDGKAYFAGGNGAGLSMTPLGFIAVEKGSVRVIELGNPATYSAPTDPVNRIFDSINGVVDKAPDLVSKITSVFGSFTSKGSDASFEVDDDVVAYETDPEAFE